MPTIAIALAIALPLLMTAGAIAAIHHGKQRDREQASNAWHDSSLDDWRAERDAQTAAEREQRLAAITSARSERLSAGGSEEEEQPVRQQRLGG